MLRRFFSIYILLVLCACSWAQNPIIRTYDESHEPLRNPLKGWVVWGENHSEPPQPSTLFFSYRSWRELEPQEGEWDFQSWEDDVWSYWNEQGMKGILRVYVDYPGRPSGMPSWLVDQGISMTEYGQFGGGFSPDYSHPLFIEKVQTLIQKIGERYNDDPRVAFVDVGILGHWGEWHTYPASHLMAKRNVQERVVDAYQTYLPHKKKMLRYPESWTAVLLFGYRDDCFSDDTKGEEDWYFFSRFTSSGAWDVWKTQPIGGEFCGGGEGAINATFEKPQECIALIQEGHFSHLGPAGGTMRARSAGHQADINEMLMTMGYRFVLRECSFIENAKAGDEIEISIQIENKGSAPFYYDWKPDLVWYTESNEELSRTALDVDIRKWTPGLHAINRTISMPLLHDDRVLKLAVEIPDPSHQGPSIKFANVEETLDRSFLLGDVTVSAASSLSDWKHID